MPFLTPCLGEGPTKIDYRKKGTLILTSPLEDLDMDDSGGEAGVGAKSITPRQVEECDAALVCNTCLQQLLQNAKSHLHLVKSLRHWPDTGLNWVSLFLGAPLRFLGKSKAENIDSALYEDWEVPGSLMARDLRLQ